MTTASPTTESEVLAAPEERPEIPNSWSRETKQLAIALAAALMLHFLPVLFVMAKWIVVGGGTDEPEIGDPNGDAKGVNVEMIDAEEFNKRYTSYGKGKEIASTQTTPPPAAKPAQQQPPAPLRPPIQEAVPQKQPEQKQPEQKQPEQKLPVKEAVKEPSKEAPKEAPKEPPKEVAKETPEKPEPAEDLDAPGLAPPPPKPESKPVEQAKEASPPADPSQQMTEAEIAEALEEAKKAQVESAAGQARSGRVSEYMRSVQRKLYYATPVFSNVRGSVTVLLIIGNKGDIAVLRIVESSGNPTIDNAVVAGIHTQRFGPPPPGSLMKERAILATYEYAPRESR